MNPLSRRSFDGLNSHLIKTPSAQLLAFKHTRKGRNTQYLPGAPAFVGDVVNLWRPSRLKPVKGRFEHIDRLCSNVFPLEHERAHSINVLAYHVRNPGMKIRHAHIVSGPQGSGKNSFYGSVIGPILGTRNLRTIGGEALASRFNNELVDVQALIIDEVLQRDGWDISNRIKPLISEPTILSEAKGESRRLSSTPRLIVVLSNDPVPLPIEESDRRYFVSAYGPPRLEPSFYNSLYSELEREVPAFFHHLLNLDIGNFNPNAAPPMTTAKLEMQRAVRPAFERQLRAWIEERYNIFNHDIIIPRAAMWEARQAGYSNLNEGSITKALKELGGVSLGQLPPGGTWAGRPRCWVIRNHEQWLSEGPTAWMRHLRDGKHITSPHSAILRQEAIQ